MLAALATVLAPAEATTVDVMLTKSPGKVAVTLTVTVQLPLTAMVPPEKLRDEAPAAGAKTGVPQLLVDAAGGDATVMPVGRLSVKRTLVSWFTASPLWITKVAVTDAPDETSVAEKFFAIEGLVLTIRIADAA